MIRSGVEKDERETTPSQGRRGMLDSCPNPLPRQHSRTPAFRPAERQPPYKAIAIQTVCCWHRSGPINQRNQEARNKPMRVRSINL